MDLSDNPRLAMAGPDPIPCMICPDRIVLARYVIHGTDVICLECADQMGLITIAVAPIPEGQPFAAPLDEEPS